MLQNNLVKMSAHFGVLFIWAYLHALHNNIKFMPSVMETLESFALKSFSTKFCLHKTFGSINIITLETLITRIENAWPGR